MRKKVVNAGKEWAPPVSPAGTRVKAPIPSSYGYPINQMDEHGQKSGLWLATVDEALVEGCYFNGRPVGPLRTFHSNGQLFDECVVRYCPDEKGLVSPEPGWQFHGLAAAPSRKRALSFGGSVVVGELRSFHRNGKARCLWNFNERGLRHGIQLDWDTKGGLLSQGTYENGRGHGLFATRKGRTYELTRWIDDVPQFDTATRSAVLQRYGECASLEDKRALIGKHVSISFIWQAIAAGEYDAGQDPSTWRILAESGPAPSFDSLLALLSAVKEFEDGRDSVHLVRLLERMDHHAVADKWRTTLSTLARPVQLLVQLARRAQGESIPKEDARSIPAEWAASKPR
ncbi:hypothetical protein LVJ94_03150 [Pendulispora rubella]|uniref:MORN repeat-containing protein n=1 Tax=Pendulispora rubella TaxID=2741070 RepID=A0ABZ2L5U8_9BACT